MNARWYAACCLLVVSGVFAGCSLLPSKNTVEVVTVQLKWTHQSQFAGMYAADQNAYYASQRLAVSLVPGGHDVDVLQSVLDGNAQFGIAGADALILAREAGLPIRAIAVIFQQNPLVFISEESLDITEPVDIVGKTVRLTPDMLPTFNAMLERSGVPIDSYTAVNLPSEVSLFGTEEADVWGAYINSFALSVQDAGYTINVIYPDDYGVHFYADTLFTTDALIESSPELVTAFLQATLSGWRYAIEHPDEMGDLVKLYHADADVDLENQKMRATVPLIHTGLGPIGWMDESTWQSMQAVMLAQGVLEQAVDLDNVYTMQFLDSIYGDTE